MADAGYARKSRRDAGAPSNKTDWRRTEVISPAADRSIYSFSAWPNWAPSPNGFTYREYGLPFTRAEADATGTRFLSAVHQDCDAAGKNCVSQRSHYVAYEYDGPPCNFSTLCADTNRRVKSERTVYHDDADPGHGSWTQYVYTPATSATSPAKVEILLRPNGSETATALVRSDVHFESLGRVWKERAAPISIGKRHMFHSSRTPKLRKKPSRWSLCSLDHHT